MRVVVPVPCLVKPLVPAMTRSKVCVAAVVTKTVPPPEVVTMPPPVTSRLKTKPRVASTVSRAAVVPVTTMFVLMATLALGAELRIVPPDQAAVPVRRLFEIRPVPAVNSKVPAERLYLETTPSIAAFAPRLSRTIHGVLMEPPVWLKTPTPSMPT